MDKTRISAMRWLKMNVTLLTKQSAAEQAQCPSRFASYPSLFSYNVHIHDKHPSPNGDTQNASQFTIPLPNYSS